MRIFSILLGGVLLIGGTIVFAAVDQQRADSVDAIRAQIDELEQELDAAKSDNLALAETLTSLRSRIAELDAQLADTTGFLE